MIFENNENWKLVGPNFLKKMGTVAFSAVGASVAGTSATGASAYTPMHVLQMENKK